MLESDVAQQSGDLKRRVDELERQVRELTAGRRLEAASIKNGALRVLDAGGVEQITVGKLLDGSYGLAALNPSAQMVSITDLLFGMQVAEVNVQQSTSTDTWHDLATAGPQITLKVGTTGRALVFWAAQIGWVTPTIDDPAAGGYVGVEVSGANSLPLPGGTGSDADVDREIRSYGQFALTGTTTGIHVMINAGSSFKLFTGLNPGNTTFKLRYRARYTDSTIDFHFRRIFGIPL